MTSAPRVLHRICASCDSEVTEALELCPKCGSKLVAIREEADTTIGTVIDGRFEIRDKLGQGGMGTVYRGWQRSVGREVAIKLMDRSFSKDAMGVRRFLREARLASQLSQPNTVSVFDFGQAEDGRLFIAMELIRGRTLHEVVKHDGAFSIERTVRIGVQICDALEAAHALGIVHRDLKLENVIVLDHPPGRDLLKVLDFGLAKNIRDPGSRATESGIVVGTPRYMSPEAATTGLAVPAGDVYALGVILGELATGNPLFDGDNLPQLVAQKLDPTSAIDRTPGPLRGVLRALLDPDPERRPTAEQARALLAQVSTEPGAGDTIFDPREPGADETTNLRPQTPRSHERAKSPAAYDATRQLTPQKLDASKPRAAAAPAAGATAVPVPAASSSLPTDLSPSMLEVTQPPAKKLAGVLIVAGAAVAVVTAAIVFVMTRDDDATQPSAQRDAAVALATHAEPSPADAAVQPIEVDAAVPAIPATIKVRVVSVPSGATVLIGKTSHKTPFDLELPRGDARVDVAARMAGYQPTKLSFVPDRDQTIQLTLTKKPAVRRTSDDEVPF